MKHYLLYCLILLCFISCEKANLITESSGIALSEIKITTWLYHRRDAVSFTFDDNIAVQGDIASLLEEHGFKGCFFVNPGLSDFPALKKMYHSLLDHGHEIGNHTLDHTDLVKTDTLTDSKEIILGADSIEKEFGLFPVSFVHPYNDASKLINQIVFRTHYVSRIASPYNMKNRVIFDIGPEWPSLKKVSDVVENTSLKGYWVIFAGHGYGGQDVSWEYLQGICNIVSAGNDLWVDKLSAIGVYDYLRREVKVRAQVIENRLIIRFEGFQPGKYVHMQKLPLTISIPYMSDTHTLTPVTRDIETEYQHNLCYLTFDFRRTQMLELIIGPTASH